MRAADWAHFIATTVVMWIAVIAVESWALVVLVIVAYLAASAAETWIYGEARDQRQAEADQ